MKKINNISKVVTNNFCVGCGACVSVCPKKAISIKIDKKTGQYLPKIDKNKCIRCGLCRKICPAINSLIENKSLKERYSYYIGKAKKVNIFKKSSSGGSVTALLLYLFEENKIDAALLVKNKGLIPTYFLAKNKIEVASAMGSKYCPVPLCMGISDILESKFKKIAVVGLPCEIQAFRNIEKINNKLKNKIYIHIGLFCSRLPTFNAQSYLLKKFLKVDPNFVLDINYRLRDSVKIKLNNGLEKQLQYRKYWNSDFKYLFNSGCLFCYDRINDFSDISFGDYWTENKNIIVLRNNKFRKFIEKNTNLEIQNIDIRDAKNYLSDSIKFKKNIMVPKLFYLEKILRKKTPYSKKYSINFIQAKFFDWIIALLFLIKFYYTNIKNKVNEN